MGANAAFDMLYDYPRDRYSRDRKGTQEVTVLKFDLSSEEADDLVVQLAQPPVTKPTRIAYTTSYEGEDQVKREVHIDGLGAMATGTEARAAIEAVAKPVLDQSAEDLDPLRTSLTSAREQIVEAASLWEQPTIQALHNINAAVTTWIDADPARKDVAAGERQCLSEIIARAGQGDPVDKARMSTAARLCTGAAA